MPARTTCDHGQFSWVDLLTEDADAAAAFYGSVLGWTRTVQHSDGVTPTACSGSTAPTSPASTSSP